MVLNIEAEVRDLVARREISKALMRYIRGQDRLDKALHLSAFFDDSYVDCGMLAGSAAEFVDFAQNLLAEFESSQHILGQMDITVDGDSAQGEIYFYAQHRHLKDGQPFDLIITGRYVDEYACRGGEWRILKRFEVIDWVRDDPATDGEFMTANRGLPLGQRHGKDFSDTRAWPSEST